MSEDRYVQPASEDTPIDRDREFTDAEEQARLAQERTVLNDQVPEGQQGTSADSPGRDPADRGSV